MGYLGSKAASGAFQAIIALMPPHDTYVELFTGSGAVLTRKPLARRSFAVDLDSAALGALPGEYPGLERVCNDALAFLDGFDWESAGRVLIYADPPYLHETRTSRHRYNHEMTQAQHVALLARLAAGLPASVILSGYPSKLYDDALPGWNTREFQAMTRGGPRTEKLWFNFEPSAVHWASYAGEDFTDRQRIKRKAARWAANYKSLPAGERLAVLAGLMAVAGEE
jgi:methylase of polypeptide subunit release factors